MPSLDTAGSILVVIPALNEEDTIGRVINEVHRHLPEADVLVVNDGSTDLTAEVARAKGVEVIDLIDNLGIGGAVQTGFKFACLRGYQVVVQMDGDGQHPAEYLDRLLAPLREGRCHVVIGSRYLNGPPPPDHWTRAAAKWIITKVITGMLGLPLTDCTSGFRAMSRDVVRVLAYNYPQDYPEPESIIMLHSMGFRIEEVPVKMRPRQGGHSSISLLKGLHYVLNVLMAVLMVNLRWRFGRRK